MKSILAALTWLAAKAASFLGPSKGSIPGVLTLEDVFKIVFGPKVVATVIALGILLLQAVGVVATGFNVPIISWLVCSLAGILIEMLRRLPQYDPGLVKSAVESIPTPAPMLVRSTAYGPAPPMQSSAWPFDARPLAAKVAESVKDSTPTDPPTKLFSPEN